MKNKRKKLIRTISNKDFPHIHTLLKDGTDINAPNEYGESVLSEVILLLQDDPDRYKIVNFLLGQGANPKLLDEERGGPLQNAMLGMDTKMLKLLLDNGADPNAEAGFDDSETLYDWAEFDYRYEIYDLNLPEEPTEADKLNENSWLSFLQRLAEKYNRRPPIHLHLLRKHGAKSTHELKSDAT